MMSEMVINYHFQFKMTAILLSPISQSSTTKILRAPKKDNTSTLKRIIEQSFYCILVWFHLILLIANFNKI